MDIRLCVPAEFDAVNAIINAAALVYRGAIASDRWKEPYMPEDELRHEIADGVTFWGAFQNGELVAVMGLQPVQDVALIRHAYTRPGVQGAGFGSALMSHLRAQTDRPMLVGTWKAATWAIAFYERRGFRLVSDTDKRVLLKRYWTVPDRQIDESVVLGDDRWFAAHNR